MNSAIDVEEVALLGEPEFVREVIELFYETAGQQIRAARAALERSESADLARTAHTLRGSSLALAAHRMADLAFALERAAHADDLAASAQLVEKLECAMRDTRAVLSATFGV